MENKTLRMNIETQLSTVDIHADPLASRLCNVEGEIPQSFLNNFSNDAVRAAVLVGLVERSSGFNILLTERAAHLNSHPGQVSFPGGRIEDCDKNPADAALREACEEVGLKGEHATVVGCLESVFTQTGFLVTPVVTFVSPEFQAVPDPTEVSEVFELPLDFVMNKEKRQLTYRKRFGLRMRSYEFLYGKHRIWGTTAAIIVRFLELISNEKQNH